MHIILQFANRICINKVDRCQPDTSSLLILENIHTLARLISNLPNNALNETFKFNLERVYSIIESLYICCTHLMMHFESNLEENSVLCCECAPK